MAKRNFLLELLEGERTYVPPPGHMIVRCIDVEQTKAGLYLPETAAHSTESTGIGQAPLGEVLAVGALKEEYRECGAPAEVGNYVIFTPNLYPITNIHDAMVDIHMDTVMLRIVMGGGAITGVQGVQSCPDTVEESKYFDDEPENLVLEPQPTAGGDGLKSS